MKKDIPDLNERITLRPVILPDEEDFLIELYYTTRDDIRAAPIDDAQKRQLSLMQYQAQKLHYETHHPDSSHDLILLDGTPAGRFWTGRYETEIIGIDLAVLPACRNLGIGTFLLEKVFEEAALTNRAFNFHVLKTNVKAMRLYERLNCKFTGETPSHFMMQWRAA